MAEYGIETYPEGMATGPGLEAKMAPTVPMSISQALAYMQDRQSDTFGEGSIIGDLMPVKGPISQAGNSPLLDSDGDYDYDKSPDVAVDEAEQLEDHSSTAVVGD